MAPAKKNVTVNKEEVKPTVKATVKKAPATEAAAKVEEPKAEEAKTEDVKVEEPKAEKKSTAKKTVAKKLVVKASDKKPAAKKAAEKKELKSEITVQFGGKSYTQDELVQIAKDVWKYDLNQKVSDLNSIELYVKPEENVAYYVMNKEFAGSFYL